MWCVVQCGVRMRSVEWWALVAIELSRTIASKDATEEENERR